MVTNEDACQLPAENFPPGLRKTGMSLLLVTHVTCTKCASPGLGNREILFFLPFMPKKLYFCPLLNFFIKIPVFGVVFGEQDIFLKKILVWCSFWQTRNFLLYFPSFAKILAKNNFFFFPFFNFFFVQTYLIFFIKFKKNLLQWK
jgi:hypothetical protein